MGCLLLRREELPALVVTSPHTGVAPGHQVDRRLRQGLLDTTKASVFPRSFWRKIRAGCLDCGRKSDAGDETEEGL